MQQQYELLLQAHMNNQPISYRLLLAKMYESQFNCDRYKPYQPSEDAPAYEWIMILRIVIISISATALICNIVIIISKKQYKFNTIRLFLFVQIFYVLSLVSVLPHNRDFNLHQSTKPQDFQDFMECLVTEGEEYKCAIEGFVNLTCYSISYWFAVCITLYIRLVLQNKHKRFMKTKGPIIFAVITIIIIWYIIPFILTFIDDPLFSFGPTGYTFQGRNYLLYSGIVSRPNNDNDAKILVVFWMLCLPVSMFIYHIKILYENHSHIKQLKQLDEINPRQFFLIKSGRLSIVIFIVQMLNVFKLILGIFTQVSLALEWVVFILNIVFDFLALVLIWIYFRFYFKEGRKLQEESEVMNNSLASSFATLTNSII